MYPDLGRLRRVFGDEIEQNQAVHCGLIVSHQCLLRNKRCLLAYLCVRWCDDVMVSRLARTVVSSPSAFVLMASMGVLPALDSIGSYERTEKIKNLRWETGTIIPAALAPKCVTCDENAEVVGGFTGAVDADKRPAVE